MINGCRNITLFLFLFFLQENLMGKELLGPVASTVLFAKLDDIGASGFPRSHADTLFPMPWNMMWWVDFKECPLKSICCQSIQFLQGAVIPKSESTSYFLVMLCNIPPLCAWNASFSCLCLCFFSSSDWLEDWLEEKWHNLEELKWGRSEIATPSSSTRGKGSLVTPHFSPLTSWCFAWILQTQ